MLHLQCTAPGVFFPNKIENMKNLFRLFTLPLFAALLLTACNDAAENTETVNAAAPTAKAVNVENVGTDALKIGDKAPSFSLKGTSGKTVSLADYKGKGAVVVFTCNHCPFSVMYEDRIIALQKKVGDKYPVIAINPNSPAAEPDDSYENMITRAKEKGFNFPYLFDDGQKIYPQYGANRTPHVFLLDKTHTVRYIGAIDDNARDASAVTVNYVENAIKAIEAGKNPEPDYTKAIGCTIKS